MDVREIRTVAEWDTYADAWRRIVEESAKTTIFQTWEWARAWWDHFGRGKRPWVLAFVEDRTVVGFAPLYLSSAISPLRTARLIGTGGSDYLDLLALPGTEEEVNAAFIGYLQQERGQWDWLDLQQIRPGAVADDLPDTTAANVKIAPWPGETCPFVALPGDWETFRKGLGKKMRSNVGYYERTLDKLYAAETRLATAKTLDSDLEAFFDLHQRRWNRRWLPGAFASRRNRGFHEDIAGRLLEHGWLRLHTLSLDGEVQAALYCFQFKGRCCYYLGGFEPTLARLSIGTVLTAQAIRHAIESDSATEFDLLRGDEGYKYRWGAKDRFNRRLSITRTDPRSALLAASGRTALQAELAFKARMHKQHAGSG